MKSEPQVTSISMFRDGNISTLDIDGQPMWLASEVADALHLGCEAKLIIRLVINGYGKDVPHFVSMDGDKCKKLLECIEFAHGVLPHELRGRTRVCLLTLDGILALKSARAGHNVSSLWDHIRNRCVPGFYRKIQDDAADDLEWLTPSQIASRHMGISSWRVGRIIHKLGLRGDPEVSMAVLGKAHGHDGAVVCHLYNRDGVRRIEEGLHDTDMTSRDEEEDRNDQ